MKQISDSELKEKLKNWRQIIAKYQKTDTKKAVIQILNSFIPFLGLWVLMYFAYQWSIWATFGLGLINAFFLVRIFIIQHDCGHQSFFSSQKVNNIVGYICSVCSSVPYKYWAKLHNYHHGHSGQLEVREVGDVPFITAKEYKERNWWGRLKYRIWRTPVVLFVIAPVYYFLIANRIPSFRRIFGDKLTWKQIKENVLLLAIYAIVAWLIGWKEFLIIQFTLVFVFGIIAFWFFYVQHQHEFSYKQWKHNWDFLVSSIKGATYYKLPKMFQWLTGNIGIHHIHHLCSNIPNYNLQRVVNENAILSKYVHVVSFWESLKMINNKLWHEESQRMISFRDFYRMEKGLAI